MSDPKKRKLLIYMHALAGGGAERVGAVLASGFVAGNHDVILAVDFDDADNAAYLDKNVRVVTLGRGHWRGMFCLARLLHREQPDVSLSLLSLSNLKHVGAAAMAGRLSRCVLSYHGFFSSEPQMLSRIAYVLTPVLTRLAAMTICVSDALLKSIVEVFRAPARKVVRIYNPVAIHAGGPKPARDGQMVLAVGRLARQKNFVGLVRAFAMVEVPGARLMILGEGPERGAIEAEVVALGLGARVSLPGYIAQPWEHYALASCLAVSSEAETFSLVVVEALACGLPVITTNCGGPPEILGHLGQMVPFDDAAAMARAITSALREPGDPRPRIALAQTFNLESALEGYARVFDSVMPLNERRLRADATLVPGGAVADHPR